jgi:outer membrane protein
MWKAVRRSCVFAAVLALSGCFWSGKDPAPFDPRLAQDVERARAGETALPPKRTLPTTLEALTTRPTTQGSGQVIGPSISAGPTIRLTLREIIQRAVANNKDIKVAGYQPAIDESRIVEAEARFDPAFFTNLTYADQTVLAPDVNNTGLSPGVATTFRSWTVETGIRQDLAAGGKLEAKYSPVWTERSPAPRDVLGREGVNPWYTSELSLQLTQPLLRDFGIEINNARIAIARGNARISLLDFREQIQKTLADIEEAYWQLVQAEGEVAIADELLERTVGTADILLKRMGQDVTRVQISQTNAELEQRRAILIRARATVRDQSDRLKRLMNDPDLPVTGGVVILPATVPLEEQVRFNLEDQIATAMENRQELGQQLIRIENTGIANKVAKNNLLPQLNAVGSVGLEGLDDNFGGAVSEQFDFSDVSWTLGLQLEIPIGNREARAIWKRTNLQRLQAIAQYQSAVEEVALNVKQAAREVDTTWQEIYARRRARFAAADALRAIEQREQGGEALTYNFVDLKLTAQQRLAAQQQAEVEAISRYNIAMARLELAKGTLLRYNNIVMQELPVTNY